MDKRRLSALFQQRLNTLFERSRQSQTAFATDIDIDRSALSQLLANKESRLPRVETLLAIAERHAVSLDWLLGLSADEGVTGAMVSSLDFERGEDNNQTLLTRWHAEARGSKIRYVPQRIPDLLRTPEVITYEAVGAHQSVAAQADDAAFRLDYNRAPGTDMESCMPRQTLEAFAAGTGVWSGLSQDARRRQLDYMAQLVRELYPSFRLFVFDARERFSAPYTIFGSIRAAIFLGQVYLVLNNADAVRSMQVHFEELIRHTRVHPHEAAEFIGGLEVS